MSHFEWIGIIASVVTVISLAMKSTRKLRIINIIGSSIFLVYGVLIYSPSLLLLNGAAIAISIYRLRKGGSES
jgi:hypothetical protein